MQPNSVFRIYPSKLQTLRSRLNKRVLFLSVVTTLSPFLSPKRAYNLIKVSAVKFKRSKWSYSSYSMSRRASKLSPLLYLPVAASVSFLVIFCLDVPRNSTFGSKFVFGIVQLGALHRAVMFSTHQDQFWRKKGDSPLMITLFRIITG